MNAIKKTDENLVKIAEDICHTYDNHHFYSKNGFKVFNHSLVLYSFAVCISDIVISDIPSNFSYTVCIVDGFLCLTIWF